MKCSENYQAIARLTRTGVILVFSSFVIAGCNRDNGRGGSTDNNSTVTGRGTGEHGDSGGNGKPYDRGGPPNISRSETPGSGRIDQGGGPTTGEPPKSETSTNAGTNNPDGSR
ncbi:MAG TPA: hypothetical protein VKY92_21190 [Verrucomicrobiae bacterium]|nr:hypothetical protein [Verrucomicrobiae bacterium]